MHTHNRDARRAGERLAVLGICVLLALTACGRLDVKDLEPGETGVVARVIDGDTLELDSGLKVQLTGVHAPARGRPRFDESRTALDALASGREARLFYGGERRLGGEVALAQVYVRTEGGRWIWLQERLLREGAALARSWPENHARAERLLAAEAEARGAAKGVWADPAYAVRKAEAIAPDDGGFLVVEGVVRQVASVGERTYLNFGEDYRTDFTILVPSEALAAWASPETRPEALAGQAIRVRGVVTDRGGPMIVADHAAQIELLKN